MTDNERDFFGQGVKQGKLLARLELSFTDTLIRMENTLNGIRNILDEEASVHWKSGWEAGIRNDPEYGQGGG